MGLKSGSRDAGLDESDEQQDKQEPIETGDRETAKTIDEMVADEVDPMKTETTSAAPPESQNETESTAKRPAMNSIPYKLRREKVNEGREQVPYFLREEIIDAEDELQDTLEDLLGEDVYKSDYREAAMVVAQRKPELIAEILREWGYDLDAV